MNTYAFDIQEIKRVGQSLFLTSQQLTLHCHLFVFRHYKWQSFEKGQLLSQTFAMKTVHNAKIFNWLSWKVNCYLYLCKQLTADASCKAYVFLHFSVNNTIFTESSIIMKICLKRKPLNFLKKFVFTGNFFLESSLNVLLLQQKNPLINYLQE